MPASATLDPCGRAPSLPGGYGEAGPPSAAVPVEVEGAAASAMNPRPAPVAGMLNTTVAVLSREARHPFGAGRHRVQHPAEMLSERTAGAAAGNAGGHHVPLGHAQGSQMLRYHGRVGRCPADVEGPHVVAAVTVRPSQIRARRRPGIVAHQQLVAKHCGLPADSDETLRAIARELVDTVRNNVTIDWTLRENVRAKLRALVKRILRRHGYPPDKQEKATITVLEQAEVLSEGWVVA